MAATLTVGDVRLQPMLFLFDVDGTLVDSNDLHADAWVEALHSYGFNVDKHKVRNQIGKGGDKLLQHLAHLDLDSAQGKRLDAHRSQFFETVCLPKIKPFPGAKSFLYSLKRNGIKIGVATSGDLTALGKILAAAGLAGIFDDLTTSDDAPESKPDPDIVEAALRRSGVAASRAVLIGDTPYDVEAGKRAGVEVIALGSGGWASSALGGAWAFFDSIASLAEAVQFGAG